jgi:hypothetical protein
MSIMETMERKQPRVRRSFTPEFKAEIVELCQRGDRSIGRVARDFDLTETAVREWVRQAERDAGTRIQRRFGDGHSETWWAADAQLGGWGPERRCGWWWPAPTRPGCRATAAGIC